MRDEIVEVTCLVVESGDSAGQRFPLEGEEMVIGRNPGTDVHLEDDGLSREHAVVLRADTGIFTIEDLQSSNGTKVNGKRVRSAELCHGDELQLGRTRFRFLEAGLPARPPRTPHDDEDENDQTQALTGPGRP